MRERVIDGVAYEERPVPGAYTFHGWRGNGHHELSARPATTWVEVGPACSSLAGLPEGASVLDQEERQAAAKQAALDASEAEARRAAYQKGNACRARTKCRRYIKTAAFNELLTLTYRANQTCLDLFKKHFREWCRRMKRSLGGKFDYCAGFELQKRGAWHAHVACHKLPKHVDYAGVSIPAWRLGTEIWRSIVGEDGGMCFVGGRTQHGAPARRRLSCARMASYVSKYITKHYEDVPEERKRYSRSQGLIEGERYQLTVTGVGSFGDVIELGFECADGEDVVSHRIDADAWGGRRYWLVTEPRSGRPHG